MGQKHKPFREFRTPFPLRDIRENPRSNVRACASGDGAICSKNRKIVPYHGANPNTRNSARLRSPSPIMAPGKMENKWIHHTCEVPGCSEGYISVVGLEKVCRTMCAAPKGKIHASKEEGNTQYSILPLLEGNRRKRLNTAGNIYTLKETIARWIGREKETM